ncbi:hypothetical protein [Anaeromicrobium sediminis]|uniref:Lipoprotein n=1 Tax=Anaeromicrobium sediminis TaxID=1478221 RepID=A0A267MDV2_9FIRM|nr:hypothetical protein [Anaeromicrobium sediminis]PAB57761.1 hypothetical protein CCE28_18240 [Anaeromicrobium sediminis]
MRKHLKKGILFISLALILTACNSGKVEPSSTDKNTKVETINNEESIKVAEDFEKILASGATIEKMKKFIDDNISKSDKDTVDKMVNELIKLQKENLEKEMEKFYNEQDLHTYNEINKSYEKVKSDLDEGYSFAGKTKYILAENIEDEKVANNIMKLFNKGYGLSNSEGSYYPVIDYKIMKENYIENINGMTADYLNIMTDNLDESTTVEEYLSVSISELKDRTLEYEEFLKNYPNSPYMEDVKIQYMVCIWKLVNPNIFDGMLDQNFKVVSELEEVYKSILLDKSHTVTHEAVQGITEFIDSKKGVLGSLDNMDDLMNISYKLHDRAAERIKELYLSE